MTGWLHTCVGLRQPLTLVSSSAGGGQVAQQAMSMWHICLGMRRYLPGIQPAGWALDVVSQHVQKFRCEKKNGIRDHK